MIKNLEKIIEYGLYLFIFLLPWQTRLILEGGNLNGYWEYGTASIYGVEIALWAIFVIAVVCSIICKCKIKNEKCKIIIQNEKFDAGNRVLISVIKCLIFIFLIFVFLSVFWAESRSVALWAAFRVAEGVGLYFLLRFFKFDSEKIGWAFISSAVAQAILGLWQFLAQSTFSTKWLGMAAHNPAILGSVVLETASERWLRAYGGLPHPNMLAGLLVAGLVLAVWLYGRQGEEVGKRYIAFKKLILVTSFIILSFGLLATFSRGAILSLVIVLILLWLAVFIFKMEKNNKEVLLKFTLVFVLVALTFSTIFSELVLTRATGNGRLEVKSNSERINYINQSWQIIKKHPVLGVGIGNYTLAIHNQTSPNLNFYDYQPVHNIYLLILAELGILGFLIFSIFLFSIFYFLFSQSTNVWQKLLLGGICSVLLAIGLFDHYLWSLSFGIFLFWLVLGLVVKTHSQDCETGWVVGLDKKQEKI